MSRRRILIVGTFLSGGGYARSVCEDFAHVLEMEGWQVTRTSAVRNRILRPLDMVRTVWRCRNAFDVAHVDVYSGHAFYWAEAVCLALRLLHRPYVLTLHGGNLPAFAAARPRRVRRLLQSAARVTSPSRFLLNTMAPYRADIKLLPNAVALGSYPFVLRRRAAPRLVWLRAFHQIYHPQMAVDVLCLLRPDFPDAELLMIGPDKDGTLATTKEHATAEGIADAIQFVGAVPKSEVPAWLSRGDVFINTTNVDNTPVSVIEAMACGLIVVSTNVGGIPYLLEDGVDALLVPASDAVAMAQAVGRLVRVPALAESLSRAGRHKVEAMSWEILLPEWEDLLSTAASTNADSLEC